MRRAGSRAGEPVSAPDAGADAAVRAPAVAGTFYPADPARLDKMIAALLAGAPASPGPATGAPLGILVPHAGLAYSGLVAAAGWRLVPDDTTVVILGTNHTAAWLDDVGAWETGRWRTPLGEVAIDTALAAEIVGEFASGEIGIAVADEDEISVQPAVAVESAGGFYGGAELVVGADQGERSGGGKELGVRSGREELVGVLGVQRFARRLAGG